METDTDNKQSQCPSKCPHCNRDVAKCSKDANVTGMELGLWSVLVFLFPLLSAVVGAFIGGKKFGTQNAQFIGAGIGFVVATVVSMIIVWVFKTYRKKSNQK